MIEFAEHNPQDSWPESTHAHQTSSVPYHIVQSRPASKCRVSHTIRAMETSSPPPVFVLSYADEPHVIFVILPVGLTTSSVCGVWDDSISQTKQAFR